jgi:hypothetical protein
VILLPEDEIETEEDYLMVDGICCFPDEVNAKPSQIRFASPFIGFSDLIKSLIVDTEDGPKEVPYGGKIADEKIIGFVKDQLTIDFLQEAHGGRGILVASPASPKALMTVAEWEEQYGTDPIALVLMMRLWWKGMGGGVRSLDSTKYKKLGKVI